MAKHSGIKISVLLIIAICTTITGCQDATVEEPVRLRPVRFMVVDDTSALRTRTFSGTSQSSLESRLSFKVGGTLVELPIEVGDQLQAGDLVARVDASTYDLQAQQSQASLVQAQAASRSAESTYDRTRDLYANNNASRNDLDTSRANAESARAQVGAAQKALELAQLNVTDTRLNAGRDCSVVSVDAELNENVSPGQTIAVVSCGETLEIVVDVPEGLIGEISRVIGTTIHFDALGADQLKGEITAVGVASGSGTTTFPVTVTILNSNGRLRPGMAGEVAFDFEVTESTFGLQVPTSSVLDDGSEVFVFIVRPGAEDGTGVIEKRPVELGELSAQGMDILSGLNPGERIVTAGVSVIRDGQTVLLP